MKGLGANGSFRIDEKAATAKPKKVTKKPKNAVSVSQPKAPKAKKAKVTIKKVSPTQILAHAFIDNLITFQKAATKPKAAAPAGAGGASAATSKGLVISSNSDY